MDAAKPTLKITAPADGTEIKGNAVSLDMTTAGFEIVKADGDTSGTTGHFHIFIDREPVAVGEVIPREPGIVHSAKNPVVLTGLRVGDHTIAVVFGDGAHQRVGESVGRIRVKTLGPSVDASGPAAATAGGDLNIGSGNGCW